MTAPIRQSHLSFSIRRSSLINQTLIPKYYDPELADAIDFANKEYELPRLGELLLPGKIGSRLGSWIRREHYGTGDIPFVRTSDLNSWRLRPDYKKGVARAVYEQIAAQQDVQADDILMVAHGTYLIGTVAIVTEVDLPLVLQDHVFRLRLRPSDSRFGAEPIDPWLVLAALSTRFVRRQIRARQFSADIIDKIGDRHLEVRVPIPRQAKRRRQISDAVKEIVTGQTSARKVIRELLNSSMRMTRERSDARYGFSVARSSINQRILVPKYYDPTLRKDLENDTLDTKSGWVTIQELVQGGLLSVNTGVEVGKMAYGTGQIPFLRTTDIAELEIKADPRQGVSSSIFKQFAAKASIEEGDVLLIRDGTYLVGSSALVSAADTPALICGGIYRLRAAADKLDPNILLGLLNLPLVRRQMRSKQFTRDVIDTLGKRFFEVKIPDPCSSYALELGSKLKPQMSAKNSLRSKIGQTIRSMEPTVPEQILNRPGWSMRG
jgi:hypothetical protein